MTLAQVKRAQAASRRGRGRKGRKSKASDGGDGGTEEDDAAAREGELRAKEAEIAAAIAAGTLSRTVSEEVPVVCGWPDPVSCYVGVSV